jgi:predicted  nucleic acid-binding Zn-ribbon protein
MVVSLALLASTGPLGGCQKASRSTQAGEAEPDGEALKKSVEALKTQLGELDTRFLALRKQVDALPQDLPDFGPVRAKFHSVEESRGITDAKVGALAGRLDAAARSGKRDELRLVARDIAQTFDEIGQLNQQHVALFHQVMALQRKLDQEKGPRTP